MAETIKVEVAYALPDEQALIAIDVPAGTTMFEAARLSRIAERFPDIDLENADMGIFGKVERKPRERELQEGDRVEIYRPLIADPKEVRKRRAEEARQRREQE
ncbi:MAG: RnfH family protein [Ketobacteraceae bacterium]|nr:RnfH family protein [Ketobacteraceae bacterium]